MSLGEGLNMSEIRFFWREMGLTTHTCGATMRIEYDSPRLCRWPAVAVPEGEQVLLMVSPQPMSTTGQRYPSCPASKLSAFPFVSATCPEASLAQDLFYPRSSLSSQVWGCHRRTLSVLSGGGPQKQTLA